VAIDRAATLRNAEKLIRQGKLEAGTTEYLRLVEDSPRDWNAKNTLGDLYARAGNVDKAVEQFVEIADNLSEEGAVAKAGAVFKKILKLKPDHEHALLRVSEVLGSQGLYADARAYLTTLVELRRARGDVRGALQARVQLGSLDPEDYEGRLAASNARIEMGDVGGAMGDLKEIARELADKGRQSEAIEVLRDAAKLNAGDEEIRERLLDVYFAAGDFARARECATTVEQFRMVAAALQGQDKAEEALDTLRQAAAANPYDVELKAELARAFVARGDTATAAEYLTAETAGDDPVLLLMVAEIHLRSGKVDEGLAVMRRLLDQDPSRHEKVALVGWNVAEQVPEAGFKAVELAADVSIGRGEWASAAAALQEFVTRVPTHVPALMRLVEICVDGGLEATMYAAQAQLADAYLAAGSATEARFISEDLVAREPWEKSNVERFRRALVMLGEPDPDAVIAERLSGESPFTAMDLSPEAGDLPSDEQLAAEAEAAEAAQVNETTLGVEIVDGSRNGDSGRAVRRSRIEEHQFELSANAIDLEGLLGDLDAPLLEPVAPSDAEVDLSAGLDGPEDIKPEGAPTPQAAASGAAASGDLDSAFKGIRDRASQRSGLGEAEKEYKRGLALRDAGDFEGCVQALEKASRSPKLRFSTSWMIGRLYRDRGLAPQALEWLERAAQAPPPTSDDSHRLLYELADGLEKVGETARALAILIELRADAGSYSDIDDRIERLNKVQA
jgi:tetratricopeptide (TPR) repeat protein